MNLSAEVLTLFIVDGMVLFFGALAFMLALRIIRYYDKSQSTPLQYTLEKQSYLASTIIRFILSVKIVLFVFFIYTLDSLSDILIGAMCAAGVVNATEYGVVLLMLKIINLYLFGYWIVLNQLDMNIKEQPYFRVKFLFYLLLFGLLVSEGVLEMLLFGSLDTKSVVDCCGAIFSTTDTTYIAEILSHDTLLVVLFYANLVVMTLLFRLRKKELFGVFNLTFVIISLLSFISFFGTYIYELPTHHCPFCMLQREYHYVGYLLYLLLFGGTFYGSSVALFSFDGTQQNSLMKRALLLNWLYGIVVTLYVVVYIMKNGVLL